MRHSTSSSRLSVRRGREGQRGFVLLFVFALAAAGAIMLYLEMPRVGFEYQRNKEGLLAERGEQYTRAIALYAKKFQRYPQSIDDLEKSQNVRFLRRRYTDPMTGKDDWRLIHVDAAGNLTDSVLQKNNPLGQQDKKTASVLGATVQGIGNSAEVVPQPGMPGANELNSPAFQRRASDRPVMGPGQLPGQNPQDPNAPPGQNMDPFQPVQPGQPVSPGQQYPGQNMPGQQFPGQQFPGQQYPGQQYPGQQPQPFPSQSGLPNPQMYPGGQPGVQPGMTPGGMVSPGRPSPYPTSPSNSQSGGQVSQSGFGYSQGLGGGSGFGQPTATMPNQMPGQMPSQSQSGFGAQGSFGSGGGTMGGSMGSMGGTRGGSMGSMGGSMGGTMGGTMGGSMGSMGGTMGGSMGSGGNAAMDMIRNIITNPRPGMGGQQGGQGVAGFGAGIVGVASKSEYRSIRVYNERQKYNEWEFIFDAKKEAQKAAAAGGMGGNTGQNANTNPLGQPANSQNSGFGQSSFGQSGFGQSSGSGGGTGFGSSGSGLGSSGSGGGTGFGSSGSGFGSSGSGGGTGFGSGGGFGQPQTPPPTTPQRPGGFGRQ